MRGVTAQRARPTGGRMDQYHIGFGAMDENDKDMAWQLM